MKSLLATAAALALIAVPAFAQSASQQDKTFAGEAAQGGKAEIDLGRYMEEHGHNVKVREFGHRMVTDHTAADTKLRAAATQSTVQLPAAPAPDEKKTLSELHKLKGAALDRAYVDDMVKDHQKDVQLFQQEAESGTNPQLKSFAQETLPTLQQHLSQAQELQKTVASDAGQHR
jgi:putative membrane protein